MSDDLLKDVYDGIQEAGSLLESLINDKIPDEPDCALEVDQVLYVKNDLSGVCDIEYYANSNWGKGKYFKVKSMVKFD